MANKFDHLTGTERGSAPTTPATGDWAVYFKSDGVYVIDDAGTEYGPLSAGDIAAHLADTTDAHDASAISVLDTAANFTGTDVEAVLAELAGGGASVSDDAYGAGWDGVTTIAPSKNAVYDKIETLSGGGTPTVQVSHPTHGATRGNTAFGSLSTAWTDSITIAANEDVDWSVDICYELASATSTWFFALFVDGTMVERIQSLYASAAAGRPYHFVAGGVVEGLSAGAHTFEVRIATFASTTFTIRDTLDTASAGDSLTATGRSSMRLRPVLAA